MDLTFKTIKGFESNAQALILKYLENHMESVALIGISLTVDEELLNISSLIPGTTFNVNLVAQKLISLVPIINPEAFKELPSDNHIFNADISFSNKTSLRTTDLINSDGVSYFVDMPDVRLVEFAESHNIKITLYLKRINRSYSAQEIGAEFDLNSLQYITYCGAQSSPPVTALSTKDGTVTISLHLPESERENIKNLVNKLRDDIFQF